MARAQNLAYGHTLATKLSPQKKPAPQLVAGPSRAEEVKRRCDPKKAAETPTGSRPVTNRPVRAINSTLSTSVPSTSGSSIKTSSPTKKSAPPPPPPPPPVRKGQDLIELSDDEDEEQLLAMTNQILKKATTEPQAESREIQRAGSVRDKRSSLLSEGGDSDQPDVQIKSEPQDDGEKSQKKMYKYVQHGRIRFTSNQLTGGVEREFGLMFLNLPKIDGSELFLLLVRDGEALRQTSAQDYQDAQHVECEEGEVQLDFKLLGNLRVTATRITNTEGLELMLSRNADGNYFISAQDFHAENDKHRDNYGMGIKMTWKKMADSRSGSDKFGVYLHDIQLPRRRRNSSGAPASEAVAGSSRHQGQGGQQKKDPPKRTYTYKQHGILTWFSDPVEAEVVVVYKHDANGKVIFHCLILRDEQILADSSFEEWCNNRKDISYESWFAGGLRKIKLKLLWDKTVTADVVDTPEKFCIMLAKESKGNFFVSFDKFMEVMPFYERNVLKGELPLHWKCVKPATPPEAGNSRDDQFLIFLTNYVYGEEVARSEFRKVFSVTYYFGDRSAEYIALALSHHVLIVPKACES